MCTRITRKKNFIIPHNISWEKKCVLNNYAKGPGIEIKEISYDNKTGKIDIDELNKKIDKDTSGLYIENPNFFGIFEDDVEEIKNIAKKAGCLFVVGADPISLGITKSPGDYGADIVIGEGRALGNSMSYGGSSLGIFACKKEFLRQIPGRIIGITRDSSDKRAFCMTLQTREQHIRRARATSNICTNEGLCALSALVYLSWLGSDGLFNLSKTNFDNAEKLSKSIDALNGFKLKFNSTHFNEFVIESSFDVNKLNKRLLQKDIQGGLILNNLYPELKNCILIGTSEVHTEEDIKRFISSLEEVTHV
jgi:glycine dehydrogenase subunit 1